MPRIMLTICAFYRFTRFDEPAALCDVMSDAARTHSVRATFLVSTKGLNGIVAGPDVAVTHARNDYEVRIGTFRGATDPDNKSLAQFAGWRDIHAARLRGKRIATFGTGSIRYEKSTSYLLSRGVAAVWHLNGGILNYVEHVTGTDSLSQGEGFVFDGRVAVGRERAEAHHLLCHAGRRPIRPQDRDFPRFEAGGSCHQCRDETSASDKARFRERLRQSTLAPLRGTAPLRRNVHSSQSAVGHE